MKMMRRSNEERKGRSSYASFYFAYRDLGRIQSKAFVLVF